MAENNHYPIAGSDEELARFAELQQTLVTQYKELWEDRGTWQTVVVVPSISFDTALTDFFQGLQFYEERMLFMLMLLRNPRTRVVFITSHAIDPAIIDYYLHLLPGIPSRHAKQRLTFLSCQDSSSVPLTQKILERRLLMQRIKDAMGDPKTTHLACNNSTHLERTLSVRLGIPLYGSDPALGRLGSKSGGREIFKKMGVLAPDGREDLYSKTDLVNSLAELKQTHPNLQQAVLKLNEGASGAGNARFAFQGAPDGEELSSWIANELPMRTQFEIEQETWPNYLEQFTKNGGIVECFLEADEIRSPSVQGLVNPLGEVRLLSTHDQVLGGPSGQIYLGCRFPADDIYRLEIQDAGLKVGQALAENGAWGRFALDFISTPKEAGGWENYAIEINLRRGGTTYPTQMLKYLTDGTYNSETGFFETPTGHIPYYYASDNLESEKYKGLTPEDLINILVEHNLSFHTAHQRGVVFHLIGALSELGKLGALCVAESPELAEEMFNETMEILDREAEYCSLDV
jgi:hypothetical protein